MSSQGECELDPSEDCQQYDKENPYVGSQVSPTDRVDSYTDTEQEFEISGAYFQKIASNIIEICNEDLPADPKERRREQEKRRRYKDKISSEQYESIIVEYSEINSTKEYTGATLTSRYLTRWEEIISDFYSTKYTIVNKNIPYGKQTMLLNDNEDKVLIFSCYPSKNKLVTQGTHEYIKTWIDLFSDNISNINKPSEDNDPQKSDKPESEGIKETMKGKANNLKANSKSRRKSGYKIHSKTSPEGKCPKTSNVMLASLMNKLNSVESVVNGLQDLYIENLEKCNTEDLNSNAIDTLQQGKVELCNEKLEEIIQILKARTDTITSSEKEQDIKTSIDNLRSDISQKINVIQGEILKVKIRLEQVLSNTDRL